MRAAIRLVPVWWLSFFLRGWSGAVVVVVAETVVERLGSGFFVGPRPVGWPILVGGFGGSVLLSRSGGVAGVWRSCV